MANIAFPNVGLESVTLSLDWPGQRIHESIYTGSQQAISRGVGRWRGTMVFAARSRSQQSREIAAIESFFALAEGAVNTFHLPVPATNDQSTRPGAGVNGGESRRIGDSVAVKTIANRATGIRPEMVIGDRVTIAQHLFQVVGRLGAGNETEWLLSPYRPLGDSSNDWILFNKDPFIFVNARFTQSQPSSPRYDVDWAGPWAASWESVD